MNNLDKPELNEVDENEQFNEIANPDDENVILLGKGRIPSPLEEVLLEFGKELVKDSVTQSVEFNKTMLGLTATFSTLMASSFAKNSFASA